MPTIEKTKKVAQKASNMYDVERRKIYNTSRWKRLRKRKFSINPLCEMCLKEGKTTLAEDIHHIQSFMQTEDRWERMALAYDIGNLMSLCKKHHQMIHNQKQHFYVFRCVHFHLVHHLFRHLAFYQNFLIPPYLALRSIFVSKVNCLQ